MTMSDLDSLVQPEKGNVLVPYHTVKLRPGTKQFDNWMQARHDFVVEKGWKPKTGDVDDFDLYDGNADTAQFGVYDQAERLVYGMRLTPIEGFEQTLSWEMVENSSIQDQVNEAALLDPSHQVWDLTRLVPGEAASLRASYQTIPKLFGDGLRCCASQGDEDPLWVFVLDSPMSRWLLKQGVEIIKLGEGAVNGDAVTSTFGCFRPAELAVDPTSDFAYRAMNEDAA